VDLAGAYSAFLGSLQASDAGGAEFLLLDSARIVAENALSILGVGSSGV
jgi:hypothetical protein